MIRAAHPLIVRLSGLMVAMATTYAVPVVAQPLLAFASPQAVPELPITQLIIRFRDEQAAGRLSRPGGERLRTLAARGGVAIAYRRPTADLSHVVRLGEPLERSHAELIVRRLRTDPTVASVELDEYVFPLFAPNDSFFNDSRDTQWHLKAPTNTRQGGANLPGAWDVARGKGVIVAVIDSGIVAHPDLDANIIRGHDFISADADGGFLVANDGDGRDTNPADPGDWIDDADLKNSLFSSGGASACRKQASSWHGTHVAGTIAAVTDNGSGVAGIAFESKVLVIRALGKCFGYSSDITDAIRWAAGASPASGTWADLGIPNNPNPARVINLSLGSTNSSCSTSRQNAITAARNAGAVVVVAAGNDGKDGVSSPANCSGVIAVTAHTVEGDKASYANYGTGTTLSAPGGGSCTTSTLNCLPQSSINTAGTLWRLIGSTMNDGTTLPGSPIIGGKTGTSMATPHVSGVAALLFSAMPTLLVDTVRNLLSASAREFPAGTFCAGRSGSPCGAGMLDATRALQRLVDLTPTVSAQASAAIVENGATVALTGTATPKAAGNTALTFQWQQTAGPVVTLTNSSAPQTSFSAPSGARLSFRFVATDADGFRGTSNSVDLRSNGTPTLSILQPISTTAGSAVRFRVIGSDPDNDPLSYTASGVPPDATFNGSSGEFSWPISVAGTYTLAITASDGTFTSNPQTVTITVTSPRSSGGGGSFDYGMLLVLAAAWLLSRRRRERN